MSTITRVTKMLEQAPMGKMVESMASALVDAQNGLTMKTVDAIERLADQTMTLPDDPSQEYSLLALGFIPSFLYISEATITAKLTFSCSEEESISASATIGGSYYGIFSASVTAGYSNKYSFSAEGASELTAHIVTVPPPDILVNRLQQPKK